MHTWKRTRRHPYLFGLTLMAMGAAWLTTDIASADSACNDDSDCGPGLVCESFDRPCPDIADYDCTSEPQTACVPAPCEHADDCSEDMVCLFRTKVDCGGSQHCDEAEAGHCAPRWQAPCEVAADCGEGFDCVDEERCWCAGSGSSSAADEPRPEPGTVSGEDAPDRDIATTDCGCEATGSRTCALQEIACDAASDCPSGWECAPDPQHAVCSRPLRGGGTDEGAGDPTSLPITDDPAPDAPVAQDTPARGCDDSDDAPMVCVPPNYHGVGDVAFDGSESGRGAATPDHATALTGERATDTGSGASGPNAGCQVGGVAGAGSAAALWWMTLTLGALRRRARR